jgi:hypothetical protein
MIGLQPTAASLLAALVDGGAVRCLRDRNERTGE